MKKRLGVIIGEEKIIHVNSEYRHFNSKAYSFDIEIDYKNKTVKCSESQGRFIVDEKVKEGVDADATAINFEIVIRNIKLKCEQWADKNTPGFEEVVPDHHFFNQGILNY